MEATRKVRIIGDIHGDFGTYKSLLDGVTASVQVGDYGLGFDPLTDERMKEWAKNHPQHQFIRGNHDNRALCQTFPNYIPDGSQDFKNSIMYIGGAWSIDYAPRREGKSWWSDEENSHNDFDNFHKAYKHQKPDIMITHDAPYGIPKALGLLNPEFGPEMLTRTSLRLYHMKFHHKPKLWIFGHWHKDVTMVVDDTTYICLGINSYLDLDLDTLGVE